MPRKRRPGRWLTTWLALVAVVPVLAQGPPQGPPLPTDPRDPLLNSGPKREAVGARAMVATQLPAVTRAAVDVLRSGGNAVDAAITAVFMQHVHDYHQVSVFGAMSGLYYDASTGRYHAFNGFSERPRADRRAVPPGTTTARRRL